MITEDTKERLRNWVRWSQSGTMSEYRKLGYPAVSIECREVLSNKIWDNTPKGEPIHDLDAELVEEAVKKLFLSDVRLGDCVVRKWIYKQSLRDLAKQMHCSKDSILNLTNQAEAAIQAILA